MSNTLKTILTAAAVALIVALGVTLMYHRGAKAPTAGNTTQSGLMTNAPTNATAFVGPYGVESDAGYFDAAGAASSLLGSLTMAGGPLVYDSVNSTSTPASMTLAASDVENYNSVVDTPTVSKAVTITFPASSTLATFLPLSGEWSQQCWMNATGTAATYITFAAGTGETLQVSTSTAGTGQGTKTLITQRTGCFTFIRNGGTGSTANDFSIEYEAFQ